MALFNSPFSGIGSALKGLNPFGGLFGGGGGGGAPELARPQMPAIPPDVVKQIFQPQDAAPQTTASAAPQVSAATPAGSVEAYIRQSAKQRGINPDTAVAVAKSEGGLRDPFRRGEGPAPHSQRFGGTENSFGPFQLYISGNNAGLGDRALATGIDPRKDWKAGIDFALDTAKNEGWGAWYGAKKIGVTGRMGIGGQPSAVKPQQITRTYDGAPSDRGPGPQPETGPWAGLRTVGGGNAPAAADSATGGSSARAGPTERARRGGGNATPPGVGPELPQMAPPEGRDPVDFALSAIRKAKNTRALRSLGPGATISVLQRMGAEARAAKIGGNGSA